MNKRLLILISGLFLALTIIFWVLHRQYPSYDLVAMMTANGLMAGLAVTSFRIVQEQIAQRPQLFVRGVYSASLLKLFVCLTGVLIYVLMFRRTLHKPTLFILFGIYAVYTAAETILLSRLARESR